MTNLESIKSNPSSLSLYQSRIRLTKNGGEWVGLCPWHKEKSPSLHVSQYNGGWVWKDFGRCGIGGDAVSFIQKFDNKTFQEALEIAEKELGSFSQTDKASKVFSSLSGLESKPAITYPLSEYKKYEDALANSPEAIKWLEGRGIKHETAKQLHWGYRESVNNKKGGWLSFPSVRGDTVVAIKYRYLPNKDFFKQPGMAKGDQTPLVNEDDINPLEPVYVVEGEPDLAITVQAGFRCVSIQSASIPLTTANKEKLLESDFIILAGDNDPTGNDYMESAWKQIQERCYKLTWPVGFKDANQVYLELCKGDTEEFRKLVLKLTEEAKSTPMPNMSNLAEVMLQSGRTNLVDHPQRLRLPWKAVDGFAVLVPGSVTNIMATSTKQGKTTWVAQLSLFAALRHNEVVLNYQCELSPEEFSTLAAAHLLRKDRNHLTEEDYKSASRLLSNTRYYIGRDPTLSTVNPVLDLIEAGIRRLGASLVVLDHIHFIIRNEQNEVQAQANAMQRIKRLAQAYKVKFIVVGQPRKAKQEMQGKLVDIQSWKGSEAGGSDCDAMIAIHRDRIKNRTEETQDDYEPLTEIHLLGCRSRGDGGTFAKLMYAGKMATFYETTGQEPPEGELFS